jgi:hypothetical protein
MQAQRNRDVYEDLRGKILRSTPEGRPDVMRAFVRGAQGDGTVERVLLTFLINPKRKADPTGAHVEIIHEYCDAIVHCDYAFTSVTVVRDIVSEIVSMDRHLQISGTNCVQRIYASGVLGDTNILVNAVEPLLSNESFIDSLTDRYGCNHSIHCLGQANIVLGNAEFNMFHQLFTHVSSTPLISEALDNVLFIDTIPSVTNEQSMALFERIRSRGFTCDDLAILCSRPELYEQRNRELPYYLKIFLYTSWAHKYRTCRHIQSRFCEMLWHTVYNVLIREAMLGFRDFVMARALVYYALKTPPSIGRGKYDSFGSRFIHSERSVSYLAPMSLVELVITLGCLNKKTYKSLLEFMEVKIGQQYHNREKLSILLSKIVDMFEDPFALEEDGGATGATGKETGKRQKHGNKKAPPKTSAQRLQERNDVRKKVSYFRQHIPGVARFIEGWTAPPTMWDVETKKVNIEEIYGRVDEGIMAQLLLFLDTGTKRLRADVLYIEGMSYVPYKDREDAHGEAVSLVTQKQIEMNAAEEAFNAWAENNEEQEVDISEYRAQEHLRIVNANDRSRAAKGKRLAKTFWTLHDDYLDYKRKADIFKKQL